jgi:2-amino-4-hydroxy-6-hydroxymethyldihydropteridine diphosphokinase
MTNGTEAYIALGSNLGDREAYLRRAIAELDEHPSVAVTRLSDIYETEPVGYTDQGPFLNMVVAVTTSLSPHDLFGHMSAIERRLGRTREIRWGPRTIDLDLLLYGSQTFVTPELTIPHPRMWDRAFVLIPLADVVGPGPDAASIASRLETLDGKDGVKRWKKIDWPNG